MRLNKILFLGFLVLYFIAGFSLLVAGSVAHRHASHYAEITGHSIMTGAGLVIALGVFILLLSLLGFIGAYKNRLSLLQIFIGTLVLILLLQLIAAILGFTLRTKADTQLHNNLMDSLSVYKTGNGDVVHEWDDLQQSRACCGVNNATDWLQNNGTIPNSCYLNNNSTQTFNNGTTYFDSGCYESARNLFIRYSRVLGGVSLVFFFVEIAGLIVAIVLLRDLKNNYGSV